MLKSYFTIAWRNLLKDRQFTLLNLLGLSTGLACVLLIYLWVSDEMAVDKFNEKDSQLYQVMKTAPNSDGTVATYETAQGILANELAKSYPEIQSAVAVRHETELGVLSVRDEHIKAKWQFADKDFFNVFSYKIIEGNPNRVFDNKYGVLISSQLALKLFNTTKNIVGKAFNWNAGAEFSGPYFISGVFTAPPVNATDQFDLVFNYDVYAEKEINGPGNIYDWGNNSVRSYVILKKGTDVKQFNEKIKDFTRSKISKLPNAAYLLKWEGNIFLRKYSDQYLYDHYDNGRQTGGRIEYIRLFSIIAIFILVIACINFMNLSTAKAAGRMKEVGIRKVIGAPRKMLILQYIGECMLLSILSLMIAVIIISFLLPGFKEISGKELSLNFNTQFILSLLSITLITGILAGSYPAIYLSGFKPAMVLKGQLKSSLSESFVRKGLVIFQFSISVILIIAVLIVHEQMNMIQSKNLGYNKDNIIRFSIEGNLQNNRKSFLSEVKKLPGVIDATSMEGDFLGHAGHGGGGINWAGKDPNLGIEYYGVSGDYNFMDLLGLKMAEGRAFSKEFGTDTNAVIFNESAIAAMGIKNPVGTTVSLWGRKKEIIGVVKDFNFQSLHKKVSPSFLECSSNNSTILVKIKAGKESGTIGRLANFYRNFNQGLPFEFRFLDDDFQAMYSSEQKVAVLSKYFAGVAIIISCLGLFGLAAFTAQKRQKEIGIRKVLGATVNNITLLLSKDFLKLVLVAMFIGFPFAWWAMNQWLQSFAYRIAIDGKYFFLAGSSIIIITLLAVSFQAIKAAIAKPVKTLRTE